MIDFQEKFLFISLQEIMPQTTVLVEHGPERIKSEESHLPEQIITGSTQRLKILTMRMLGRLPNGERDAYAEELLQQSATRLRQALEKATVPSTLQLFVIAAGQIRAELLTIARNFSEQLAASATAGGTMIASAKPEANTEACGRNHSTAKPEKLEIWTNFHSSIERLPEQERQTFDLIWYHDLTQREAAKLMENSELQLRRHWISARLRLRNILCTSRFSELE